MAFRAPQLIMRLLRHVLSLLRKFRSLGLVLMRVIYTHYISTHRPRENSSPGDPQPRLTIRRQSEEKQENPSIACCVLPSRLAARLDQVTDNIGVSRQETRCVEREDTLVASYIEENQVLPDSDKAWLEDSQGRLSSGSLQNSLEVDVTDSGVSESGLPSGAPELCSTIDKLYPVDVSESERYTVKSTAKITKGTPLHFTISPFAIGCAPPAAPLPWTRYVHPEGIVYYWDCDRRVVTDADVLDPAIHEAVERLISHIEDYIREYNLPYPSKKSVHLYLEHYPTISAFGYYFVCHAKQTLFWLDRKDTFNMVRELFTPSPNLSLVGTELRSHYWFHNEYFPHILEPPQDALLELQDLLWHATGDMVTSSKSIALSRTIEEAKGMRALVSEFVIFHQKNGYLGVGAKAIVYRFLGEFCHEHFLNFHGEKHARGSRDQSVYVNRPSWDKLISGLEEHWRECILYATVLLTSNVSFLAIQSLDDLGTKGYRAPAQQASYISIMTSIGAMIIGFILIRQYSGSVQRSILVNSSMTCLGEETLALLYSLPYALLMYGHRLGSMIAFLVAFALLCIASGDKTTIGLLGLSGLTIILLLIWCLSVPYRQRLYGADTWVLGKYNAWKTALEEKFRLRRKAPSDEATPYV
ncbi:hypothetical protein NP233_g6226 [Leucocoprinus birnbaumii]|uniref:Uncharacterized protein n=1 Tax=Leucocoprinus birnbaumii TaxID=56174 RepID=A0AAD5VRI8_9AGAR|nr:hypothetical protein NP233_g6226 [Leucocoprinus birnbaumii]